MKRPVFETVEKKQPQSLLLVDKEGVITQGALSLLPEANTVVADFGHLGIPSIPDAYYSHIFVVVHDPREILAILPQFLEKARRDTAHIFFIVDLLFAQEAFLQELVYSYRNARVMVMGDVFGDALTANRPTTINRFFHEANTRGIIQVSGDGLTQVFPVLFRDAVAAIVASAFSQKAAKISYIFPKHAPTQLSLARLFQTINPFLRINFVDEKQHSREVAENEEKKRNAFGVGTHVLQSNYPLLRKIKETQLLSEENVVDSPKIKAANKIRYKKLSSPPVSHGNNGGRMLPLVIFLLSLFFVPFFVTLLFAGLGIAGLSFTKQALLRGDVPVALQSASASQTFFGVSQTTGNVVLLQAHALGLGEQGKKLQQMLVLGQEGSYGLRNGISGAQTMLAVVNKKSSMPEQDFIAASNKLKKAVTIFQKFRAQGTFLGFSDMDGMVALLGATIDSYPTVLGMHEPKTYLLLFQNNAELRPAGGFIGSYGLLTLDKGSVSDFQIHDVYDADGQLKGHVEPAYPFRRYMGVVHQYLRDSNYAADFPTAASSAANMLAMETGTNVSGVIGIDTSFMKSLVEAIQPIYVPDYKETVTAKNFYILTQTHAEKDFFPGSTQKKDFLRSLYSAMQLKLSDKKQLPYLSLAKVVTKGIEEKHILFAFSDLGLQKLYSANNLSASLSDRRVFMENQYHDFLGISEANIGVNKANAFVFRKVEQRATIDQVGRIKNTVTIRYKNESKDWPGGDYKNYLRFIVPRGARLSDITIDGKKQIIIGATTDYLLYERPDFIPPQGLEVETYDEMEKTFFGFLVIIPKGTFKTVTISYASPTALDMGQQVAGYNLWYFKQPGTDAYPYSFIFSYPENVAAFRTSTNVRVEKNSAEMEKTITTDQHFSIDLSKK